MMLGVQGKVMADGVVRRERTVRREGELVHLEEQVDDDLLVGAEQSPPDHPPEHLAAWSSASVSPFLMAAIIFF